MSYTARKRAFAEIGETCPDVDAAVDLARREIERDVASALDDIATAVKRKATEPLRDALIAAYQEIERLESEISDATDRIEALESDLRDATAQVVP